MIALGRPCAPFGCSKDTTLGSTREAMRAQGYIPNVTPIILHKYQKEIFTSPCNPGREDGGATTRLNFYPEDVLSLRRLIPPGFLQSQTEGRAERHEGHNCKSHCPHNPAKAGLCSDALLMESYSGVPSWSPRSRHPYYASSRPMYLGIEPGLHPSALAAGQCRRGPGFTPGAVRHWPDMRGESPRHQHAVYA